jgi:hypothetical protein
LRLRAGPFINVVFALSVSLGSLVECLAESAAQKNIATPPPPTRRTEPVLQDKVHSTGSTGKEGRGPGAAESAAAAAAGKHRVTPQTAIAPTSPAAPEKPPHPPASPDSERVFPSLPAASRSRMRDCGREWQEMKKTGQAKELTWRDFATRCLTRRSE